MFVKPVEDSLKFTRAIQTIARYWDTKTVEPGTSTLFFVNDAGWALTCKHVGQVILATAQVKKKYADFKQARNLLPGGKKNRKAARALQEQYAYKEGVVIELQMSFVNCVDTLSGVDVHLHDNYDVALLKFNGFSQLGCTQFPVFAKQGDDVRQGKTICRLGYPFPEFQNFEYDSKADEIKWTAVGRQDTPPFPIEGMITRFLGDLASGAHGFEVSTPGLRGQSGGPAFGVDGRILGMQSATNSLDLKFDLDRQVMRAGKSRHVKEYAFMHVGHCVHVDVLKAFMQTKNVSFSET